MEKFIKSFITIFLSAMFIFPVSGKADYENDIESALKAYQDMRFKTARKITKKYLNKPEAELIYYLCFIYDKDKKDIPFGLKGLKKIINNPEVDSDIWSEAALSYARVLQIAHKQNKLKDFSDNEITDTYKSIIKKVPSSAYSCIAVTYMAEPYFFSKDKKVQNKGFKLLEDFLRKYKGDPENTITIHLYIERMYVNLKQDYKKSFSHLESAYKIGITSDVKRETVLFRLGRISEVKLKNNDIARKYYNEFLKKFPYSNRASIVKRYLKNLK